MSEKNLFGIILLLAALVLVVANFRLSKKIILSPIPTSFQKFFQIVLIWLLPGAVFIMQSFYKIDSVGISHAGTDNYSGVSAVDVSAYSGSDYQSGDSGGHHGGHCGDGGSSGGSDGSCH